MPKRFETGVENTPYSHQPTVAPLCILANRRQGRMLPVLTLQVQGPRPRGGHGGADPHEPYLIGKPFPHRTWSASTPSHHTPLPAPREPSSSCRGSPWFGEMGYNARERLLWLPLPLALLWVVPPKMNPVFFLSIFNDMIFSFRALEGVSLSSLFISSTNWQLSDQEQLTLRSGPC